MNLSKTITKILTISLITAAGLPLLAKPAFAQSLGLSLSPPLLEIVIKPGKTASQIFSLKNLSENSKTVVARVIPFVPQGNLGLPLLKPNLHPDWLDYLSLNVNNHSQGEVIVLAPGEIVPVILKLAVPANAPQTDHYATLLITTNPQTQNSKIQIPSPSINTSLGANILISISDNNAPSTIVKIDNFVPLEKDYLFRYGDIFVADNFQPIHFTATAVNIGKYKTRTSGLIQVIKNKNVVSLQSLLPLNLLASSERQLQGSPSGEIVFQPTLTDIGSHQVLLDIRSENSSSHSELTVVLVPIRALTGLVLGLTLTAITLKMAAREKKTKT